MMEIKFTINNDDDVVNAITILKRLLSKSEVTEQKIIDTTVAENTTVEQQPATQSVPEFETSSDSPVMAGETTPDMMIQFITTKLRSMAKNGHKEQAKDFMRARKIGNLSDISSLSISKLEKVYQDVSKI